MTRLTKSTLSVLILASFCTLWTHKLIAADRDRTIESKFDKSSEHDDYIRGKFTQDCSISLPVIPSHAVYYDANGDVVTYKLYGVRTALVEDMSLTFRDRFCPADPSGPGACVPPKPGYCSRTYGGYPMCVPC